MQDLAGMSKVAGPLAGRGGGGGIGGWTTYYRSTFTYDGLGRRVRIEEAQASTDDLGNVGSFTTTSDCTDVWSGNTMAEARLTAHNSVVRLYFSEGMHKGGSVLVNGQWVVELIPYYYTRDHLGSIREVTEATGAVSTRYDYDPFGKPSWLVTGNDADFGFTGYFRHARSGLYLSLYRVYDPVHGRWISRDPLENAEMSQGPNLYSYVTNDPVNGVDLLGLYG